MDSIPKYVFILILGSRYHTRSEECSRQAVEDCLEPLVSYGLVKGYPPDAILPPAFSNDTWRHICSLHEVSWRCLQPFRHLCEVDDTWVMLGIEDAHRFICTQAYDVLFRNQECLHSRPVTTHVEECVKEYNAMGAVYPFTPDFCQYIQIFLSTICQGVKTQCGEDAGDLLWKYGELLFKQHCIRIDCKLDPSFSGNLGLTFTTAQIQTRDESIPTPTFAAYAAAASCGLSLILIVTCVSVNKIKHCQGYRNQPNQMPVSESNDQTQVFYIHQSSGQNIAGSVVIMAPPPYQEIDPSALGEPPPYEQSSGSGQIGNSLEVAPPNSLQVAPPTSLQVAPPNSLQVAPPNYVISSTLVDGHMPIG